MFEIHKLDKRIILAIVVILAFVVYWFYFRVEGFDNKEACALSYLFKYEDSGDEELYTQLINF